MEEGGGTDVTCNSAAIAGCRRGSLGRGVGWRRMRTTRSRSPNPAPAPAPPRRGRVLSSWWRQLIGCRRRRRRSRWWGYAPAPGSSSPAHSAFGLLKICFSSKQVPKTNKHLLCYIHPSHHQYIRRLSACLAAIFFFKLQLLLHLVWIH